MKDLDKRMAERRARVEAARAKTDPDAGRVSDEVKQEPEEDTDDYWSLPKTGAPTTVFNSAWTWTLIIYVVIMTTAAVSLAQSNLTGALERVGSTAPIAIAVALIYPAWRIGALISKFLKTRGIDMEIKPKSGKTPKPGSVEARMAERRARLEKARQEGKI